MITFEKRLAGLNRCALELISVLKIYKQCKLRAKERKKKSGGRCNWRGSGPLFMCVYMCARVRQLRVQHTVPHRTVCWVRSPIRLHRMGNSHCVTHRWFVGCCTKHRRPTAIASGCIFTSVCKPNETYFVCFFSLSFYSQLIVIFLCDCKRIYVLLFVLIPFVSGRFERALITNTKKKKEILNASSINMHIYLFIILNEHSFHWFYIRISMNLLFRVRSLYLAFVGVFFFFFFPMWWTYLHILFQRHDERHCSDISRLSQTIIRRFSKGGWMSSYQKYRDRIMPIILGIYRRFSFSRSLVLSTWFLQQSRLL